MLWRAFMFEAGEFLRLRATRGRRSLLPVLSDQPTEDTFCWKEAAETGSRVTLASLGMAPTITHALPSSKTPLPMSGPHRQVASTVKIDLSESISLPLLSAAGSWSGCIYFKNLIAAAHCDHLNTDFFGL